MKGLMLLMAASITFFASLAVGCQPLSSGEPPLRVGILIASDIRESKIQGLTDGLERYGFYRDQNLQLIIRNAQDQPDRLPGLARELVELKPDLIVATGASEALAAQKATRERPVPIIFVGVGLPQELGLVESLAHPGGHITGVDNYYVELSGKRLEHFHRLLPEVRRITVIYDPRVTPSEVGLQRVRDVAGQLGIAIQSVQVTSREDVVRVISGLDRQKVDGAMLLCSLLFELTTDEIHRASIASGIPVLGVSEDQTRAGLLASYGMPYYAEGVQASRLVAKVLRGQDPGLIPVESPARVEFVVNLETAARLGLRLDPAGYAAANQLVTTFRPRP